MQPYKIMRGLWGMGQTMFTNYIGVVDDATTALRLIMFVER
jgi:3-polyprenyl-4-hydroxybenzoate decarboxylase